MKTKFHSTFVPIAIALLAASALVTAVPRAPAQGDTVTISAAEFQRMAYSSHLLTTLFEKPELDASLQVLLELQRRNPHADPAALTDVLRQTTARYRTDAPAYIRNYGSRDEILAAYLDALRQVPARTNLVPANLSLLNRLMTRAQAPRDEPQADMIHSGSQSLLGSEGSLAQRQALLDACIARAQGHAVFRAAMDGLLLPETLVSLGDSPAQIIGNTNSALHGDPTMQTLLALSAASGDGSLTVSSNQLMTLFTDATQSFWDIIHTNLAVQREINQSQPDLPAYLTNQPAIDADAQRLAAVRQGQPRKLASATAAVLVQSKLMAARDPLIKLPGQMQGVAEGLHKITDGLAAFSAKDATKLGKVAASGNILAGALGIFDLFFGGESPDEEIVREIGNVKILIEDLSKNMNYRFDRVDQSLVQIYETLNEQFDHLGGDVDQIRLALLDVQTGLFRVERNLNTFHALDWRIELVEDMNYVRGFEGRAGHPMPYTDNAPSDFLSYENAFFTHAFNRASLETLSRYTTLPFGDEYFHSQLSPGGATNVYAETLNYIKKCLRERLGLTTSFPEQPVLANPQDWAAGASAWLQLAVENPGHFRRYERTLGYPDRLDDIISKGRELTNFLGRLTFTGTNVNRPLYAALQSFYLGKLTSFTNQVRSTEQHRADEHAFGLDLWRQWSSAAPRPAATGTALFQTPYMSSYPIPSDAQTNAVAIASGRDFNLALKTDGAVVGWGRNTSGQATIPAGLSNVVAIAAGSEHSLALKADGTVVGWGANYYGETTIPAGLNNVVAIAAGDYHTLALKADGTVVGWGDHYFGETNGAAAGIHVVAIAAGGSFNLALKADGTVVGWGRNSFGQTTIPSDLSNVVAIAAGGGHSLALRADGAVVGWGFNNLGQTTIPAGLSNVVAIDAGAAHNLALKADGTAVGWGWNNLGEATIPAGATNIIALAGGDDHSTFLTATGAGLPVDNGRRGFTRAPIPTRVADLFRDVNEFVLTDLDLDLHRPAIELSGAKAVLQAVLELGMPYTLERDDVLHGFLYGSESLVDMKASRAFLAAENSRLAAWTDAKPQVLSDVAALLYLRFAERLEARLNDLAATGEPELPRLVEHTLRLLNLLRDAWASVPPPALEIGREANALGMVLYGEPYARYTLQHRDSLSVPGWTSTTITNLHSEQSIRPPISSNPQGFYRTVLPSP